MNRRLYILIAFAACAIAMQAQNTYHHYAKSAANVTLQLNWKTDNYGTIQWQRSQDQGTTWTDLSNAVKPSYTFKAGNSGTYYYRVVVNGDEACEPIAETHVISVANFTTTLVQAYSTSALFEISGLNIPAEDIADYGFAVNYNGLSRTFSSMPRTSEGSTIPGGETFEMTCKNLLPNRNYSVRVYFKTRDGSLILGTGKLVKTTIGLEWSTEDWVITKNTVRPRFLLSGNVGSTPQMKFEFGTKDHMQTYSVSAVSGSTDVYQTATIRGLKPSTDYIARVTTDIDGEEQVIEKTVRTMTDYSTYEVDEDVVSPTHRITWDAKRTLIQLNPSNIQAEYPRMIRISSDSLLLAYHGGDGSGKGVDHWLNIYLQRSTDNGKTWSDPEKIMDKTKTWTTNGWYRFTNPELIKLQNGWIVMTFTGNANPETNQNCQVLVMISKDGGNTWGDPITVMRGRTWEPMIVQLPGGELELFVSSEAAWWNNGSASNQEIRFARSTDNGLTWTESQRASYNPNARDGMPVGVVLQGNKGVLFSIESPGTSYTPSLLHRNLNGEWESGEWDHVQDSERWVNTNLQGGCAPHMIQLPTGEIVMAAHLSQAGSVWQTCRSQVSIGDNTGHNFTSRTVPFPTSVMPTGQGAYYSSLFLKDETTIWLIISHSTYDGTTCVNNKIEYLEGKISSR
ncbi:MAG: exo-alpha-sialidase [Prevotella sp.]|nr:exo-alpha-sialidase [Prevotella sp.]